VASVELGDRVVLAELVERVVRVELAVQAVSGELDDQVVPAALELVLAAAVLEPVQVAAVPVLGHLRAHLAVPLGIKSVTALHHRGQVAVPRAGDLRAAAETTPAQAATEAEKAWGVVATAVAAVAVAGAE